MNVRQSTPKEIANAIIDFVDSLQKSPNDEKLLDAYKAFLAQTSKKDIVDALLHIEKVEEQVKFLKLACHEDDPLNTRLMVNESKIPCFDNFNHDLNKIKARLLLWKNRSSDDVAAEYYYRDVVATAEDYYSLGLYYLDYDTLCHAINFFQLAINKNEKYAEAYHALSKCHTSSSSKKMFPYDELIKALKAINEAILYYGYNHQIVYFERASINYNLRRYDDSLTDLHFLCHQKEANPQLLASTYKMIAHIEEKRGNSAAYLFNLVKSLSFDNEPSVNQELLKVVTTMQLTQIPVLINKLPLADKIFMLEQCLNDSSSIGSLIKPESNNRVDNPISHSVYRGTTLTLFLIARNNKEKIRAEMTEMLQKARPETNSTTNSLLADDFVLVIPEEDEAIGVRKGSIQ